MAKMMLCAYAKHPELGILVIDPQGEFAVEFSGTPFGQQGLQLKQAVASQGRPIHVFRISDIQLDDWNTFEEMLISLRFFEQLSIPSASAENARRAAEVVRNALESTHNLDALGDMTVLQAALNAINDPNNAGFIYTTKQRAQQLQQRIQRFLNDQQALNQLLNNSWQPICQLFTSGQNRQRLYSYSQNQRGIINLLLGSAGTNTPRPRRGHRHIPAG